MDTKLKLLTSAAKNVGRAVAAAIRGENFSEVSGRILTADAMNAHNTFDRPHAVEAESFDGAWVIDGTLTIDLPPMSLVVLELR